MKRIVLFLVPIFVLALKGYSFTSLATSTNFTFRIDTRSVRSVMSEQEAVAFWPITWRKGETVTVMNPHGTTMTLVSVAGSEGEHSLELNVGGLWHFSNSTSGSVTFGVPWSIFNDGGMLATGTGSSAIIDTKEQGPGRCVRAWNVLPIAYSGDSWTRSRSSRSVLTLVSPSGRVIEESFMGTGYYQCIPSEKGKWRIALDNGVSTFYSDVLLLPSLFCVSFR